MFLISKGFHLFLHLFISENKHKSINKQNTIISMNSYENSDYIPVYKVKKCFQDLKKEMEITA